MRSLNEIFGPDVLARAKLALADQHSVDADEFGPWEVRARLDRDRSTVARLEGPGRHLSRTFTNPCRRPRPATIATRFENFGGAFRLIDNHGLSQNEIAPAEGIVERHDRLTERPA